MNDFREVDPALLGRAVDRLDEALADYKVKKEDDRLRDSIIVRFMFTYELAIKTLARYLTAIGTTDVPGMGLQNLIRTADEKRLLRHGWPEWKEYRDARNQVAHTYDEERAKEVARVAKDFAQEARFLYDSIARSTDIE